MRLRSMRIMRFCALAVLVPMACDSLGPELDAISPITLVNRSGVHVSFEAYERELAHRTDFTGYRLVDPEDAIVQPGDSAVLRPVEIHGYTPGASLFLLLFEVRDGEAFSATADGKGFWYAHISPHELKAQRFRLVVYRH
jgi:hypothetical protein